MNVFIVGGRGNIGQEVALGLIRQAEISQVILGDMDADLAGLRVRLRKNQKISMVKIDASHAQTLTGMLTGVKADVVVNCAGPFLTTAPAVIRACVGARINYIDVCDDHETVAHLYDSPLDRAAREAGITVLTGMGSDPGTNNLIAKSYADRLDRVAEVALYWVVGTAELTGPAAWAHSFRMTQGKIPQFLNGRLEYVEGGTGEERVGFPEPLGNCLLHFVGHPQPLTLPRYLPGLRTVVVKGAILPADRPAVSGLKVVVKGERQGAQVTCTAEMVGAMGAGTGLPAAIAVRMLGAGEIQAHGLVAPEGCIDPEKFLAGLRQNGAIIRETETVTPPPAP